MFDGFVQSVADDGEGVFPGDGTKGDTSASHSELEYISLGLRRAVH